MILEIVLEILLGGAECRIGDDFKSYMESNPQILIKDDFQPKYADNIGWLEKQEQKANEKFHELSSSAMTKYLNDFTITKNFFEVAHSLLHQKCN